VSLVWHRRTAETPWRAIAPAFWLFGGSLISLAAVALPFALSGALDDFLYANLSYNWVYVGFLSGAQRLANLGLGLLFFCAVAAPFVAGALAGLVVIWRKRSAVTDYVLILWAIASAIGVASGGRFFPHYFLQLMPSLAVLTGVLIYDRFVNGANYTLSKPAWITACAVLVVSIGTTTVLYLAPREAEDTVVNSVYYQKEWEDHREELGLYIKERTAPLLLRLGTAVRGRADAGHPRLAGRQQTRVHRGLGTGADLRRLGGRASARVQTVHRRELRLRRPHLLRRRLPLEGLRASPCRRVRRQLELDPLMADRNPLE
jgi:hypothetical protein